MADEQNNNADASMLTVAQVCERLQVSKWTLNRLIRTGELESVKIGSRRRIPVSSIAKFVEQLREEEGGPAYGG